MTLKELRELKAAREKSMRELHDKAETENRGFTPEEKSRWDQLALEHSDTEERIARAEKLETGLAGDQRSDRQREEQDRFNFEQRKKAGKPTDPDAPLSEFERSYVLSQWALGKTHCDPRAIELCNRAGLPIGQSKIELVVNRGFSPDGIPYKSPRSYHELQAQRSGRGVTRENRAAQKVNLTTAGIKDADGSLGGYTVPDEMMGALDAALLQWGGMRQVSTVYTTSSGADFPIPTANDTAQKGEIIGENTSVNEQEVTFGQLVLGSYKYSSKMIKVSVELLQDSGINLPTFLGDALGTRLGRITNDHFTTGTGTSQPRGITVAAANSGITAGTAGALTYPEIMGLKHTVDPAYRDNALFMMHDATLKKMKVMVDSQNRPLWMPSLIPGEPATFDGDGYIINQSMPSTAATKGLIYGDMSKYIIREVRGITLMRLDERFAELHQVAFLAFARYDGDLLDAGTNPVKYFTLA